MSSAIGRPRQWTVDRLVKAVENNRSIAAIIRELGLSECGGNYATIKKYVRQLGLGTRHWTGQGHLRGRTPHWFKPKPLTNYLVKNGHVSRSRIKSRLIKEGILALVCALCRTGSTWNGRSLVLVLDHMNGDPKDYTLSNLRLLCPNCNSQTETFAGRNIKGRRKPRVDPSELLAEWQLNGTRQLALKYKASPSCVREWIREINSQRKLSILH